MTEETYAERLSRIAESNRQWRENGDLRAADRSPLAVEALRVIGDLYDAAIHEEDIPFNSQLGQLCKSGDCELLLTAKRFGEVALKLQRDADEPDSPAEDDYSPDEDWDLDSLDVLNMAPAPGVSEYSGIISVVHTLRSLNLLDFTEVPEADDPRFCAHLYAKANYVGSYFVPDEEERNLIRLVDEFPGHRERIAELLLPGTTAQSIRAVLLQEIDPVLMSGIL